jgi:hypothetical protein
VETRVFGAACEIVDAMAEFVEKGDYFVVLEERGLGLGGFGEVAD